MPLSCLHPVPGKLLFRMAEIKHFTPGLFKPKRVWNVEINALLLMEALVFIYLKFLVKKLT